MKKISKESNIATAILLLVSIVATVYNHSLWFFIWAVFIFYIALIIMVNRLDKKHKTERKKRNALLFDESAHWHDELTGSFTFKSPLTVNQRCMLDEQMMWPDGCPESQKLTIADIEQVVNELKDKYKPFPTFTKIGGMVKIESDEFYAMVSEETFNAAMLAANNK